VNQLVDDPDVVVLYEQYDDEAAFQAHIDSEHFQRIVPPLIFPLLAERSRETFRTLD
jgi:quinol monooxygenase YgiN